MDNVKAQIQDQKGIPLICGCTLVDDNIQKCLIFGCTLFDNNIQKEYTLTTRLRGGMQNFVWTWTGKMRTLDAAASDGSSPKTATPSWDTTSRRSPRSLTR